MAAESVLGLPAVRPALLDDVSVAARRRSARARRGTEGRCAWNAFGATPASCTGDARGGGTREARSC